MFLQFQTLSQHTNQEFQPVFFSVWNVQYLSDTVWRESDLVANRSVSHGVCACVCVCKGGADIPAVAYASARLCSVCRCVSVPQNVKHTKEEGLSCLPFPSHLPAFHPLYHVIPPSFPLSFLPPPPACPLLVYLPVLTHSFTDHPPLCLHLSSVLFLEAYFKLALPTFHSPPLLISPSHPLPTHFLSLVK